MRPRGACRRRPGRLRRRRGRRPGARRLLRSSAKPLQALPLARAYENLGEDELAIAAASHFGTPEHVEVVRRLLAATGGSEDELDCGLQDGRPPEPIFHNCSGKHAGMIAVCRANGWPVEGYRRPDHPLQLALLGEVAAAAESSRARSRPVLDGCGVVCFGLTLERAASRSRGSSGSTEAPASPAAMRAIRC